MGEKIRTSVTPNTPVAKAVFGLATASALALAPGLSPAFGQDGGDMSQVLSPPPGDPYQRSMADLIAPWQGFDHYDPPMEGEYSMDTISTGLFVKGYAGVAADWSGMSSGSWIEGQTTIGWRQDFDRKFTVEAGATLDFYASGGYSSVDLLPYVKFSTDQTSLAAGHIEGALDYVLPRDRGEDPLTQSYSFLYSPKLRVDYKWGSSYLSASVDDSGNLEAAGYGRLNDHTSVFGGIEMTSGGTGYVKAGARWYFQPVGRNALNHDGGDAGTGSVGRTEVTLYGEALTTGSSRALSLDFQYDATDRIRLQGGLKTGADSGTDFWRIGMGAQIGVTAKSVGYINYGHTYYSGSTPTDTISAGLVVKF